MRTSWLAPILVGLIVLVGVSLLPKSIKGNEHAHIAAAIAFVASLIVKQLPLRREITRRSEALRRLR